MIQYIKLLYKFLAHDHLSIKMTQYYLMFQDNLSLNNVFIKHFSKPCHTHLLIFYFRNIFHNPRQVFHSLTNSFTIQNQEKENINRTLFDINCSNNFFDSSTRVMANKNKQWDLIKFKSCYTAKETINKMKRQPTEQEKIFAKDATNKGLISKIYKQLMWLNT